MTLLLHNIGHSYGPNKVLSEASLKCAAGEIVCLLGPSGCGKTTLLRIVAGLEPLQAGEVELDGAAIGGVPAERRDIGFVFQDYVLFPHLTALGNVGFGLKGADRRKKATEELQAVGLQGVEHRYPHQLSGGQQQRVALARALARRPRAMLLDEPFASVDAVLRRRLREELRGLLKDRGVPALFVTHDPEEALAIGDHIAIMRRGRILEVASPQTLFERPGTAEGASLFTGSQQLEGQRTAGVIRTAFGDIRNEGNDEAVVVIALPGGVALAEPENGCAVVSGSRFVGPGWEAEVIADGPPMRLRVPLATEPEIGRRCGISFDPKLIRVFPGNA